jgi:hypothetical protein
MTTISSKLIASSTTTLVTGLITYVLVTFVPAFKNGIPAKVTDIIPVAVALVLGTIAGYMKTESPHIATTAAANEIIARNESVARAIESQLGALVGSKT